MLRNYIIAAGLFSLLVTAFALTSVTTAQAKLPICKSANGTYGQWQFVVSTDLGDTSLLIQMFRKKQFDLRFEYLTAKRGTFGIRGKTRGTVREAKLLIDGQPVAHFTHDPSNGKPANPTWRGQDYANIYAHLLNGKSGKIFIRLNTGDVRQFNIALKDYHRAYNAAVPHYNRLSKLYVAKKCRGAFDF